MSHNICAYSAQMTSNTLVAINMDNLLGLRAFVRVVELGNFSEAGRQLGMAPSSVSRQISQLEDDLAVQLFNRTTRKVSLTEAGKLYHQRVSRIITDLDDSNRLV
ncbi:MAG: LysR family transcriptional regulator, partial [Alphaproteobacteria bacterium]